MSNRLPDKPFLLNVRLPFALYKELKEACKWLEITITNVIIELITEWLKKNKKKVRKKKEKMLRELQKELKKE
jgi:hypothetical protein